MNIEELKAKLQRAVDKDDWDEWDEILDSVAERRFIIEGLAPSSCSGDYVEVVYIKDESLMIIVKSKNVEIVSLQKLIKQLEYLRLILELLAKELPFTEYYIVK